MSVFRSFLDQFQQLRNQSTTSTKLAIGVTAAVCIALIIGVGIWSSQPQYVPLAQDLAPAQAAEIVSKLNADGIKNKLNYAGSAVLVDKSKWNRARIVAGDIAGPNQVAAGDFAPPAFSDPALNDFYLQQHLEKRLAASIARLKTVQHAVVHLNVVKSQVFLRDKGKSSASVVVEPQPGKTISSQDAKSIVQLVSSSVKDLSAEDVKVIDTDGKLMAGNESQFGSSVTEYYGYRRRLEADLELKAESLLANMLGQGKAVVRVTADLDFNQETSTEITHPVAEAIQRETSETNTQTLDKPGSGFAGTASNIGSARSTISSAPVVQSNTKTDKDFVVGSVEFRKQKTQGEIIRLSIAAMVDLNPDTADASAESAAAADKTGKATAKAANPKLTKDEVESIIKAAVGFDEERYDEIEVVITSLAGGPQLELLDAPVQENWGFYNQIIRNASLGVAALFAFAFAVMTLRKMRPITVVEKSSTNISPERARHLSEMATLAKQHPEAMARIIAAWINEPATETAAGPTKTAASSSRRAA